MTAILLSATPTQRKNLLQLVGYLMSIQNTPKADEYDHSDEERCTFGFAVLSQKIKALNARFMVTGEGRKYVKRAKYNGIAYSDLTNTVFGKDYWSRIVYGPYTSSSARAFAEIKDLPKGREQMNFIIKAMISAYKMTPEELAPYKESVTIITNEVDTTRNRILDRITKLEAFVNYASAFDDDDTIKLTSQVQAARDDIKALKRALAL